VLVLSEESKRDRSIAVLGILSGAFLGVVGALVGVYTSHEQISSQADLAHVSRVYDRRADAYLDALSLIEKQRVKLTLNLAHVIVEEGLKVGGIARRSGERVKNFLMAGGADAATFARVEAFGTSGAVRRYQKLRRIVTDARDNDYDLTWKTLHSDSSIHPKYQRFSPLYLDAIEAFERADEDFMNLVHAELS
jgi:hypothetical protein